MTMHPGLGPMGNQLKAGILDLQGQLVGGLRDRRSAWRLLDHASRRQTCEAVFYVGGILAERYPDLMKAIVAAGHDIAAHSWGWEHRSRLSDER